MTSVLFITDILVDKHYSSFWLHRVLLMLLRRSQWGALCQYPLVNQHHIRSDNLGISGADPEGLLPIFF